MSNVFKSAAVVAAVVVAVAGCDQATAQVETDAPALTPAPASTSPSSPSPVASPPASPTPIPSPTVIEWGTSDRQLEAGTYRVADPSRPYTISFPAAWTLQTAEEGGLALYRTQPETFAPSLIINRVHQVFTDPCHPDPASPDPGPMSSGDEIIAQLSAMKGFTAGAVSPGIVAGLPSRSIRLTNDVTFAEAEQCEGSPLDIYQGGLGTITTNQGATDLIRVVDVDGTPVIIHAQWVAGQTPPALIAEVAQVIGSIQYEP